MATNATVIINQQNFEQLLNIIANFETRFNQIEFELKLVTRFLNQQFGDECLLRNNSNGYGEMDGDEDDDDDILPADQSLELVYKSEPYSQSDDNQTNGFHISNGSIDYNDDDDDIYSVHSECSASAEGNEFTYEEEIEEAQPFEDTISVDQKLAGFTEEELIEISDIEEDEQELLSLPFSSVYSNVADDPLSNLPVTEDPDNQWSTSLNSTKAQLTTEKPYKCKWPNCNKAFTQKPSLTRHAKIHNNNNTKAKQFFSCKWFQCGENFLSEFELRTHQITHTNNNRKGQPFICNWPDCTKQFTNPSQLQRHAKSHKRKFCCEWTNCGRKFIRNEYLINHRRIHTGEKPYICYWEDCVEKFTSRGNLFLHKKRFHSQ